MSYPLTPSDLEELAERPPRDAPPDPLGVLLDARGYVAGHVFDELYEPVRGVRVHIGVSRYYWTVKVAVDFERDAGNQADRDQKRAALARKGIRYLVIRDAFDTKTAREQLHPRQTVQPGQPPVAGRPRQPVKGRARAAKAPS